MKIPTRVIKESVMQWFLLLFSLALPFGHAYATEVITYYHNDALGSPVAATDELGNILWQEAYEPYGKRIIVDGASKRNEQFYTGKQEEVELGLQYFGARWYDPDVGRFLSMDPEGFHEGNIHSFNRYVYANNNPYSYVDPDGESPIDIGFLVLDSIKFGMAVASGNSAAIQSAGVDLAMSAIGLISPVPGTGQAMKALKLGSKFKKFKGPCRLSCFVAGTTILAEQGYVAIESLKEGDLVWAHNPETGETALKPIVRTFLNTEDSIWQLRLVDIAGNETLHEVTGSHPYYSKARGWVTVDHLVQGERLEIEGGGEIIVASINDTGIIQPTYNFEVQDIHTYYVSAAKVLVHNCGGVTKSVANVPGRVQSRINISNDGWAHTLKGHFNPAKSNKSQFTISQGELKSLLQDKSIVQSPARQLETGNFGREITLDRQVGNLAEKWGGGSTNTFSIVSDSAGNLLTATPGKL